MTACILTILIAAIGLACLALAATFIIGPIYRSTLPKDYAPKYQPTGQTHLNPRLP